MNSKKKKICIAAVVVASVITFGAILGISLVKKADEKIPEIPETGWTENGGENADSAFVVTPQNTATTMSLTARASTAEESSVDSYIVTATTSHYGGDITWSIDWTGTEVFWNTEERTTNVNECVALHTINNRSVLVECLKPFGQPIAVTARLNEYPSISDSCVCNYEQRVSVKEMRVGFNSFLENGEFGYAAIVGVGTMAMVPATVNVSGSSSLAYSCDIYEYSYTQTADDCYSDFYFTLTPNLEVFAEYGLDMFNFKSYSGTFDSTLSGEIDDFFDSSWCQYAVNRTGYSIDDFVRALVEAENEMGFSIESSAAYTLTLYGLPGGDFNYEYRIDLYSAVEYVKSQVGIQLNNSSILFKG